MSYAVRKVGRLYAFAVAVLLLIVLAACDAEAPEPIAIPAATAIPVQETSDVLRLVMPDPNGKTQATLISLDPGIAVDSEMGTIINLLFEPLVAIGAKGEIVPAAAHEWAVSEDGRSFTFTLRPQLRWSDGSPLTAADFEYAWKRSLNPDVLSASSYLLYPVDGAMSYADGILEDASSVAIEAISDRELRIRLLEPSMSFPARIASWPFAPVPKQIVSTMGNRWAQGSTLVSNGPYMLDERVDGMSVRLIPNPNYHDSTRQPLNEIMFKIVSRDTSLTDLFADGEVDVVELRDGDLDVVRDDDTLRGQSAVYETAGNWFLVFNALKKPWDDARVRRALSLALDREQLVGLVFEGAEMPSASLLPNAVRSSGVSETYVAGLDRENNARALLAEAGYSEGEGMPPITFSYHQTARWDRLAEYLKSRWSLVLGIEVRLDVRDWKDFLNFTVMPGDFDIYRAGWNTEYLDPENWHNVLWLSQDDFLRSGWVSVEYDDLIKEADVTRDDATRRDLYAEADVLLDMEMPGIPLATRARAFLIAPNVHGIRIDPLGGHLILDLVRVS